MAKKKHTKIKRLIRNAFDEAIKGLPLNAQIGSSGFIDGAWKCSWTADVPFPEGFDTSIRDSAMKEIESYMEEQYNKMSTILETCFGSISSKKSTDPHWFWYNFTFEFPPMYVAVAEYWDHIDGVFQKVEDARLATDEELKQRLDYMEEQSSHNKFFAGEAKRLIWEMENWQKYFRFVGGSPFTDELFEATHYAGLRMRGDFSFRAFGEYIPTFEISEEAKRVV